MQSGTVDRISELPEFILHNILSILDTKEAGRASVLSKRWYQAWSSIPVLDFRIQHYVTKHNYCSASDHFDEDQGFLGIVDRTMLRYDTQQYRIRKLYLDIRMMNEETQLLGDRWIRIAVQNQVEELHIGTKTRNSRETRYRLPGILFRAKSLKVLSCSGSVLPYYETMELISLEYLSLLGNITVDADLLQRIISFCPLIEFITTTDLKHISLPWDRKLNKGAEVFGTEITRSKFKASPLRKFSYHGDNNVTWALSMDVVALKNLRELKIDHAPITDDIVSELAYGLVALETLVLASCSMLKCIMISSNSLKKLRIKSCLDLVNVTIDAANLIKFWYHCEVKTSLSLIRKLDHCNAQFTPSVGSTTNSVTTDWFVKIKEILYDSNLFQSLVIHDLPNSMFKNCLEVVAEEDQLRNVVTNPPYKLRELKLRAPFRNRIKSPLMALNGLFWICHPDVLSISTSSEEFSAETILDILKCKVQCWKHPLKSIELEGIDHSRLLSYPWYIEYRFRLSWHDV